MKKNVLILGSTGSIGKSTLEVIDNNDNFNVISLVAKNQKDLLLEQANKFNASNIYLSNESFSNVEQSKHPNLNFFKDLDALIEDKDVEIVVAAISGLIGVDSILKAIQAGKKILIANKEPIVVAGKILMSEAKKSGAEIIPIDSEHCAIHQCLSKLEKKDIKSITLTCSGGPFWGQSRNDLDKISYKEAKKHPVWNMGEKNLIDSATLMNKALEIIEARWLFDINPEKIKVLIHPQSIIHGIVENIDGSSLASMSAPDMKICIAYGLGYPDKIDSIAKFLNLLEQEKLEFFDPKDTDFPSLEFAYRSLEGDDTIPAAMNAANEIAVSYFLNNKVKFNSIFDSVDYTMDIFEGRPSQYDLNLQDLLEVDKEAKKIATDFLSKS